MTRFGRWKRLCPLIRSVDHLECPLEVLLYFHGIQGENDITTKLKSTHMAILYDAMIIVWWRLPHDVSWNIRPNVVYEWIYYYFNKMKLLYSFSLIKELWFSSNTFYIFLEVWSINNTKNNRKSFTSATVLAYPQR